MNKAFVTGNTCTVIKDSSNATGIRAEERNGNKPRPHAFSGALTSIVTYSPPKIPFKKSIVSLSSFICGFPVSLKIGNDKIQISKYVDIEELVPNGFSLIFVGNLTLKISFHYHVVAFGPQCCFISDVRGCEE